MVEFCDSLLASWSVQRCNQIHVNTTSEPSADIVHPKEVTPYSDMQDIATTYKPAEIPWHPFQLEKGLSCDRTT
jgi:hypothetical protein